MATGIDSASSTHACIWCKVRNDERYKADKSWSTSDTERGARTVDENATIAQRPKSRKEFNVSRVPLFQSIPLTHVVIDNLHLFLRVSDVLIDLLIIELRHQDAIVKVKTFNKFDVSKYKHIDGYQTFISGLGIPGFQFHVGQSSKQLKCRSLTGPEKIKLHSNSISFTSV